MNYWLLKSEPNTYSIDTLFSKPNNSDDWDGVRNYQARNFLRMMKKGDKAFFYHSSTAIPSIVGLMEIIEEASLDTTAENPKSPYYDPKSKPDNPRWSKVRVKALEKFKIPLTLATIKQNKRIKKLALIQPGNRLSVMPVLENEWKILTELLKEQKT